MSQERTSLRMLEPDAGPGCAPQAPTCCTCKKNTHTRARTFSPAFLSGSAGPDECYQLTLEAILSTSTGTQHVPAERERLKRTSNQNTIKCDLISTDARFVLNPVLDPKQEQGHSLGILCHKVLIYNPSSPTQLNISVKCGLKVQIILWSVYRGKSVREEAR